MPFLQEIAPEILLIMFFINGFIWYGDTVFSVPLKTPFDISKNLTNATIPQGYNVNSTHNIVQNITNPNNFTTSNPIINLIQASQNILAFLQYSYVFIEFISGGFIWSTMAVFFMPQPVVYILEGGIIFLLGRTIYYYVTGK